MTKLQEEELAFKEREVKVNQQMHIKLLKDNKQFLAEKKKLIEEKE